MGKFISVILLGVTLASCAAQQPLTTDQLTDKIDSAIIIRQDNGGNLGDYINKVSAAKKANEFVEIRGDCFSGCTLWTSMPPDKICVDENAVLGFHDGTALVVASSDAITAAIRSVLMSYYPPQI